MANRERTANFHMYFSEEEFELLQRKVELSESNSMSEFIRRLVVYGAVFSIDFRELHETNSSPGKLLRKCIKQRFAGSKKNNG